MRVPVDRQIVFESAAREDIVRPMAFIVVPGLTFLPYCLGSHDRCGAVARPCWRRPVRLARRVARRRVPCRVQHPVRRALWFG